MSKKVLFCATVDYHFKAFHLPYLKWFKEQGWEVHVAAAGELDLPFVDKKYNIPIQRSPFRVENLVAYKELKGIVEQNRYQIIHCHTPMGGLLARLAARMARKNGTKVIYTAHGFHFCKGASLLSWLIYYPIEKWLAHLTDCLITINSEDYELSNKRNFKAGRIEHIHGVGVNTDIFQPTACKIKEELRGKYQYNSDDFLLFYAAELNKNKNQKLLIHALAHFKSDVPKARLLLAGEGHLKEVYKKLAVKLGVQDSVEFLGQRDDVQKLLTISDVAVASSLREGLPVNILEAMACGLPIVAMKNRGHTELVKENGNGYLLAEQNSYQFAKKLTELYRSKELCKQMGRMSREKVLKYSHNTVEIELSRVYSSFMLEDKDETKDQYYRAYI